MTKSEAEKLVRSIKRTCRGPRDADAARLSRKNLRTELRSIARSFSVQVDELDGPELEDLAGELRAASGSPDYTASAHALARHGMETIQLLLALETVTGQALAGRDFKAAAAEKIAKLVETGNRGLARKLDDATRAACGADVNGIILSTPLDGEGRVGTCPRCGQEFRYTPPEIEIAGG